MESRWILTQLVRETRELRRSPVGLSTVLTWAGISVIYTVAFFNLGQRFTGTADLVYNYWQQLLVLSFPIYLYPAMIVSGEVESGRWEFLCGIRVPWWRLVLGKWLFVLLLTGVLVLLTGLVFIAGLGSSGFVVSGNPIESGWPLIMFQSTLLVWLLLVPVVSQGLFFSCAFPNRPASLIASLGFYFVATIAASSLHNSMMASATVSVVMVPAWALAILLQAPATMGGLLVNQLGLVRRILTFNQGGTMVQQSVGYPVLGGISDYVVWIVAETLVFLIGAVLILAMRERKQ